MDSKQVGLRLFEAIFIELYCNLTLHLLPIAFTFCLFNYCQNG